jgi:hypothetical protein
MTNLRRPWGDFMVHGVNNPWDVDGWMERERERELTFQNFLQSLNFLFSEA